MALLTIAIEDKQEIKVGLDFDLKPVRILYKFPATIVWWNDGTKTVVKAFDGFDSENKWIGNPDAFSTDAGFAQALSKKLFGGITSKRYEETVKSVSDTSGLTYSKEEEAFPF